MKSKSLREKIKNSTAKYQDTKLAVNETVKIIYKYLTIVLRNNKYDEVNSSYRVGWNNCINAIIEKIIAKELK